MLAGGISRVGERRNLEQSRSRYYEAEANCSTCQQIRSFEKFLFIDTPLMFTGFAEIKWGAVAVKGGISIIAQSLVNGAENVDVIDVLADSFLRPGYSGAIGANYDYTIQNMSLEVNDSNKKNLINTATSLLSSKLGGGLSPLIQRLPASGIIQGSSDLYFSTMEQTVNKGYDEKHK